MKTTLLVVLAALLLASAAAVDWQDEADAASVDTHLDKLADDESVDESLDTPASSADDEASVEDKAPAAEEQAAAPAAPAAADDAEEKEVAAAAATAFVQEEQEDEHSLPDGLLSVFLDEDDESGHGEEMDLALTEAVSRKKGTCSGRCNRSLQTCARRVRVKRSACTKPIFKQLAICYRKAYRECLMSGQSMGCEDAMHDHSACTALRNKLATCNDAAGVAEKACLNTHRECRGECCKRPCRQVEKACSRVQCRAGCCVEDRKKCEKTCDERIAEDDRLQAEEDKKDMEAEEAEEESGFFLDMSSGNCMGGCSSTFRKTFNQVQKTHRSCRKGAANKHKTCLSTAASKGNTCHTKAINEYTSCRRSLVNAYKSCSKAPIEKHRFCTCMTDNEDKREKCGQELKTRLAPCASHRAASAAKCKANMSAARSSCSRTRVAESNACHRAREETDKSCDSTFSKDRGQARQTQASCKRECCSGSCQNTYAQKVKRAKRACNEPCFAHSRKTCLQRCTDKFGKPEAEELADVSFDESDVSEGESEAWMAHHTLSEEEFENAEDDENGTFAEAELDESEE